MIETPTRQPQHRPGSQVPTAWGRVLGLALGVAVLLGLVITAFAWPNVNSAPRGIPVGVVAPPQVAGQLGDRLAAAAGEDAFEISVLADQDAAEQAIRDREVYGAILLGPDGGRMLTATAASPAVASALGQLAANVPAEAGGPLQVTDVVPLPDDDPRGVGLGSAVLPIVIGGIASGALSCLQIVGRGRRLATVLAVAVGGGLVLTLVMQTWFSALAGSFWANAGVLALGICAIGTTIVGLHRFLGTAAIGLVAAVMVLLGNPLSGAMSAPEMLPAGWGALGQVLPPGATATALRSVGWFDGAGSTGAFIVLGCWIAAGLLLTLLPGRSRSTV